MRRQHTTQILTDTLAAGNSPFLTLETLLVPLQGRAFGCVLLLLAIPNFIPAPIGIGGIMGSMIIVLGLQMLIGMRYPWVPARLRHRPLRRTSVQRFLERTLPLLRRLEHLCRPRMRVLTRGCASLFTGLLLTLMGFLLALPIPFTNYLFGMLMLAYAMALIEQDGALLLCLWLVSLATIVLTVVLSKSVLSALMQLF
jgi:hypothetical protein